MPRKFYFDFKDGVTQRDSHGSSFKLVSEAILYSKTLAHEERMKNPTGHRDLIVSVVNESGAEVHTELVYPLDARLTRIHLNSYQLGLSVVEMKSAQTFDELSDCFGRNKLFCQKCGDFVCWPRLAEEITLGFGATFAF